jgi:hypothetical protein
MIRFYLFIIINYHHHHHHQDANVPAMLTIVGLSLTHHFIVADVFVALRFCSMLWPQ